MWDRTLIESKGFDRASRRWWTVPLSAGLHIALIVIAIFASYWHVEAIESPLEKMAYVEAIPVAIGPPPAHGGGPTNSEKPAQVKETPVVTQPAVIPPLQQKTPIQLDAFATECETCSDLAAPQGPGTPHGVPGGDSNASELPLNPYVGTTNDQPKQIVAGMMEPVLISRVEPEYPRAALIARAQGMVILEAIITKTGTVEQVKTLRADHALLEKTAIDAVRRWKYRPAMLNNKPVKVYFTVTVIFKLK
jgi:periplasmic protein TonB